MEKDKSLKNGKQDLFFEHKDEITPAFERAVREALKKHKLAGNPVAVSENGKVVLLQPEDIEVG